MSRTDTIDLLARRRNKTLNTVHTLLLVGGCLLLLAVTALAFAGPAGLVYAAGFGVVSMIVLRNAGPKLVLAMYKARPVSRDEFPAGVALVERLSKRAGLPSPPTLHVIPSEIVNAFAVGRRDEAVIAISDGLARALTMRELAGVLAHEISHIAHGDMRVMALADIVSRATSLMSSIGLISLLINVFTRFGGYEASVPWMAVVVLLAAPTVGGMLQLALSRTREFDADLGAAVLTGDPDGIASALTKLEKVRGKLWEGLMLPGSRIPDPSILRTHPLTSERVARLMALKIADHGGPPSLPPGAPHRPTRTVPRFPQGAFGVMTLLEDLPSGSGTLPGPDDHASAAPLNPPKRGPRIHVMRGGVWW